MVITVIAIASSCKKSSSGNHSPQDTTVNHTDTAIIGLYALGQGTYGANNTTLTYYNFATNTASTDTFENINGFKLGDTGSDFIIYGGRIYIVMNNSGYVSVANALNARYIDSVSFQNGSGNKGPENIVAYGGKVFVSTTDDSVSVIDTATLAITKNIAVGANPAQMAIVGTNLYVSNTGGFSTYDSTVSVIDLNTLTETRKIKVGLNPGYIAADASGNIYVACTGDYGSVAPQLVKVSTTSNTVTTSSSIGAAVVRYYNNKLYVTGDYLGLFSTEVLSTTDLSVLSTSFVSDGTTVEAAYGLDIDDSTGNVYISDAKDYTSPGEVFCFDNTGKKKFSFSVAPTPSPIKVAFLRK